MSTIRKIQWIIGILGILLPVLTLFIPFYESVLMLDKSSIQGLLYTYEAVEVGDIAVISGLGSLFAWIHVPFCIALSILLILDKPNLAMSIACAVFFGVCTILVYIGCSAGFGKPIGDSMLVGYPILSLTEIVLITFSIYLAAKHKTQRNSAAIDF